MGRSKAAKVAPPRLSAEPNRTMPEMVNCFGGPTRRILTLSPTLKWYFAAVPASIATCVEVRGAVPLVRFNAESSGSLP